MMAVSVAFALQRIISAFHNGRRIESEQGSGWNNAEMDKLKYHLARAKQDEYHQVTGTAPRLT